MKNRERWVAGLSLAALLLVGVVVFYLQAAGPSAGDEVSVKSCEEAITLATTGEEYFRLAMESFGGHLGYDLRCADVAFAYLIKQDPEYNDYLWYQAGRVDFLRGQLGDAVGKFDEQIERFGESEPAVYYMRGLTKAFIALEYDKPHYWELAETDFRTYLELNPASPWALTDLSWTLFMQEKYEEQLALTSGAVDTYDTHAWLYNMHGLALLNTGDREGAAAAFLRAKELAADLTPEWWGAAYPGNDPRLYENGLAEFRTAIDKNLALTQGREDAH